MTPCPSCNQSLTYTKSLSMSPRLVCSPCDIIVISYIHANSYSILYSSESLSVNITTNCNTRVYYYSNNNQYMFASFPFMKPQPKSIVFNKINTYLTFL